MGNIILWRGWGILIVILILAVVAVSVYRYSNSIHRQYQKQVNRCLEQNPIETPELITEDDLADLPAPVKKYLDYVGVVGTEKVSSYSMTADGEFRMNPEKDWAPVEVEQMSFIPDPARLFFIRMKLMGVGITALHHYESAAASMVIRLLDLITVGDARGPEMNQGETVTVFNDMCLLAPSTLIDSRIGWKEIDAASVEGTFTNDGISVTATLRFNEQGQLVDFVSDDRYYWNDDGTYNLIRWSTPIREYREINGLNLPAYAEANWMLEDGPYTYARFNIRDVMINPGDKTGVSR